MSIALKTKDQNGNMRTIIRHRGITIGCSLAMIISWSINKSILWAIVHGIFSWFYIIYYALGYGQ